MSLFQEFEKIKNNIDYDKYSMINKYLETICTQENIDNFFKEMNTIWKLPPEKWNDKTNQLKQKYGVVLLDDVIYKKEEWAKYECWYNENRLSRNVEILGIWNSDYDDIRCNAILYKDGNKVANIIASYDETDVRYSIGDQNSKLSEGFVNKAIKSLLFNNFDSYLKLPVISKCSKLLQSIYDCVCESDVSMCHITDKDWEDYYSIYYSDDDIEMLKKEIKKYHLDDVIGLNDAEYKIVGYGDLETKFNDDRNLELSNEGDFSSNSEVLEI